MKYEDFEVKTFNDSDFVRVTHKATSIRREKHGRGKECIDGMIHEIIDEIQKSKRPCSFATALEAVVKEGKGMHVVGDTVHVVRAQYPDDYSMMDLPYLYMTTGVGQHPWSIETCAPFATWLIID